MRINIGIDIDGVINDLYLFHMTCGTKFCYENNINVSIHGNEMDSLNIFGWSRKTDDAFWRKYYLKLLLYPDYVRPYVSAVTKILHNKGHRIFIISARNDSDLPNIEKCSMYNITQKYLTQNHIYYDKLILEEDKWNAIFSFHINVMIEDNPSFFTFKTNLNRIPVFCFDTPYNQNIYGKNILRVYSWHDILLKIDEM